MKFKALLIGVIIFISVNVRGVGVEEGNGSCAPNLFFLTKARPNPFCYKTRFSYGIPQSAKVKITIYNIMGKKVAVLGYGVKKPGFYTMCWSGKNEKGKLLKSGIYFYEVKAGKFKSVKKLVLLRA